MRNIVPALLTLAASLLAFQAAGAQAVVNPTALNPAPGCKSNPAVLTANRKLGEAFFRANITTDQRLAMLDEKTYIQHNPVYMKYAREHGTDERQTFMALQSRPRAPVPPGQPPLGNPLTVVTAECDLVTIVHKSIRPDPVKDGEWFEAYSFDTFRVRGGKFVEHWDSQLVTPDNPPPVTPK